MRLLVVLALVFLGFLGYLLLRPAPVRAEGLGRFHFVDVAAEAGLDVVNVSGDPRRWYIPESNGNGAAWLDFEDDGDLDLFVGNGQHLRYHEDGATLEVVRDATSRLYLGDGFLHFRDASAECGADRRDWVNGVAAGDADGDGDTDLYLACFGPDAFLRKEGNRFIEATAESGLANELWGASAAFGDANRDGQLDLYVANYCLFDLQRPPAGGKRNVVQGVEVAWGPEGENKQGYNPGAPDVYFLNDGQGRFREFTAEAGFKLETPLCSYGVAWSDVTGDGWPDLLVANDLQPANLFVNQGERHFWDAAARRGFALNHEGRPTSAMGLIVADVDDDADFDVLRTNFDLEPNCLHVNDGAGVFADRAAAQGLGEASVDKLGWDAAFFDADRDGDLDLLVANGHVYPQAEEIGLHPWLQRTQLFEGLPHLKYGTTWKEVAEAGPGLAPLRSARGVAVGDPDNDGDLDVLVVDLDSPPRLLRNDTPRRGHWLGLALTGKFSNRDATGARVQVKAGDKTWTREVRAASGLYSSHDPRLFFGLGERERVDAVTIRWPNGNLQVEEHVPIDCYHAIVERAEDAR